MCSELTSGFVLQGSPQMRFRGTGIEPELAICMIRAYMHITPLMSLLSCCFYQYEVFCSVILFPFTTLFYIVFDARICFMIVFLLVFLLLCNLIGENLENI